MNVVLSVGVLIFTGYILGELAGKVKLPKVSGYILAGILLNPDLSGVMSSDFVKHTDPLLSISLSFITFSIGGSLSAQKLKATGRTVFSLTLLEAFLAFACTFVFLFLALQFLIPRFESIYVALAVSLVLASLAAPTDPSATLAVIHEYQAKGEVSTTMLEIAAFDDLVGIVIYTLVTSFATFFLGKNSPGVWRCHAEPGRGNRWCAAYRGSRWNGVQLHRQDVYKATGRDAYCTDFRFGVTQLRYLRIFWVRVFAFHNGVGSCGGQLESNG